MSEDHCTDEHNPANSSVVGVDNDQSCSVHCTQNDFQLTIVTYLGLEAIFRTCHCAGTCNRLEESEINTSYEPRWSIILMR